MGKQKRGKFHPPDGCWSSVGIRGLRLMKKHNLLLYRICAFVGGTQKLFKFNSMIFLKHLNGIFFFFSQLQWNPIAQSKRRKTCSFMSIINF
ncbi:MAG: hypothetical protein IJK84_04370, partial [Bacteroidales bacterium]|nr:hypothetical protein [Bacteroidales bacterium]